MFLSHELHCPVCIVKVLTCQRFLDYYVADLDIRLKKENIAARLKQNDTSDAPEKYLDDTLDPGGRVSVKKVIHFFGGFHGR